MRLERTVKVLSNKHEGLNLISRSHVKDLDRVAFAHNPSTGKAETGGPLEVASQPVSLVSELQIPPLKN